MTILAPLTQIFYILMKNISFLLEAKYFLDVSFFFNSLTMQIMLVSWFCLNKKHKIHYQCIITVRLKWKPISLTHSELKEWMYPLIISQTQRDSESFIWIKQQLNYSPHFVLTLLNSLPGMDYFHFVMWLTKLQNDLEIFNCPRRLWKFWPCLWKWTT